MNYLRQLCRLPILSLLVSSLLFGAFPAQAESQVLNTPTITDTFNFDRVAYLEENRTPTSKISLAQTKVSPELEKQILQVIRKHPDVLLEVLQKYAIEQQQKEQKAQADTVKLARKDVKSFIGDSPTMGAKDRKIVMVEFSDFQCPYCSSASVEVKKFMAKHKDKVTLVYKHFPLTQIHPEALPAARAAWAANKQGKFWEYHDALFANQAKLGEPLYLETATKLKLDLKKFNADRKIADAAIVKDFTLGRKVGVEGTPTFILNGEVVAGSASLADLEKALAEVNKK
jgi:protein-disulfide isomerase